jgi:hypothetical protein
MATDKHAERTKRHGMTIIGVIVVVALLVGSFVLYPNQWHELLSFAGGTSATTTMLNGNPGICPANSQAPVVQLGALNYSPVAGAVTLVAAPDNVTASSTNNKTVVANTKMTAGAYVTLSSPGCGITYTNIVGDNLNWYLNKSSGTALPGTTIQLQPQTFQYSAATSLVANSPQATPAANSIIYGQAGGNLVTAFQESIVAGRGWYGYPGEGFDVVYSYNSLAVTSILLNGQAGAVTSFPITSASGDTSQSTFTFPAGHFSQDMLQSGPASSSTATFGPSIQLSSGFSGTTQNTFIGQTLIPLTNFQGVNGQWYSGAATYTVAGINGQAAGTVIAPTVSAPYFMQIQHS